MSSIIMSVQENMAIVATDTLAVDSGSALLFTNKATYLPTLKTIIAGTGLGAFSSRWAEFANSWLVADNVESLTVHAPEILKRMWVELDEEGLIRSNDSTTVYHIGFNDVGVIAAYALRSRSGFKPEPLAYGLMAKPECEIIQTGNVNDFVQMMHEQRRVQEGIPENNRIYIGGEINAIVLQSDRVIHLKLGEFSDYRKQLQSLMMKNR